MGGLNHDTIAAISTPMGEGGIGIVRISGPLSLSIADRLFQSPCPDRPSSFPSHTLHYGFIIEPQRQERIDEVLLAVMRAPHSYTREDVVEIHAHGGLVSLLRILELILQQGVRPADPGEFTKRAFLNGRIDLAQAEAVMDIVQAKSERGLKLALRHLDGSLSRRIGALRDRILSILAQVEASIDFPEEDLGAWPQEEMGKEIEEMGSQLWRLILSFREGRIVREGVATALVGRANVGKSSLFNSLLNRNRAIVTPHPGTTRDSLEEVIHLQGYPFLLIDTAGMRADDRGLDMAEKEGLERGRDWMGKADLLLVVMDGSENLTEEDRALLGQVRGRRGLLVINKIDLEGKVKEQEIVAALPEMPRMRISATDGTGLQELKDSMVKAMQIDGLDATQDLAITHLHHQRALERAEVALGRAKEALADGLSYEFVSLDLHESLDALGEITGETTPEDLLNEIFSRFCIGK
jgi:tRNA modification GTPase